MNFILNNILYIIPVVVLVIMLFMSRHRLKEKRVIIWTIILSVIFTTISLYIYFNQNGFENLTITQDDNYEPFCYEDIMVLSAMVGSLLWIILKFICSGRGYPVSYFSDHHRDISNSVNILMHDNNASIRVLTGTILTGLLISFLICFFLVFNYFINF